VEVLQEREDLIRLLELLDSEEIRLASIAERRYLELMGGSCRLPLGAYARFREGEDVMELTGFLAREDGINI
ncbi:MAG: hydroxymethylbilane synthase, partial [Halanaerobiales bacterium]